MNTLTEIYGMPSSGKTHAAISGWPNALLVDTAFTSMAFREMEIDSDPNERGESWPILLKLCDYDTESAEGRYKYLDRFPHDVEWAEGYDSVILDNAADLRVLAVHDWCEETGNEWPQQAQWSAVNDRVDWLMRELKKDHHVVVISQMKDEYVNDTKTGEMVRDGPKRMEFKADFRIQMEVDDGQRHSWVEKNRHIDQAGSRWVDDLGSSVSLEDLMLLSGIPESEWGV